MKRPVLDKPRLLAVQSRGGRSDLVREALQEGGLQLRHEGLEPRPRLADEQAECVQDGRLDLPGEAVADDADERPCMQHKVSGWNASMLWQDLK